MKNMSKIIWIIALIVVLILLVTVGYGYYRKATMEVVNPIATMEVENFGTIKIELYPEMAPETVANFIALANRGFYDGLTFHRIVKDFMIQGGDKNGDGTGNATLADLKDGGADENYCIKGEFIANSYYNNKLKFEEGVIAMARSDYSGYSPNLAEEGYNSASSQFFIMTKETESLNGNYAAFGRVIEGLDIVHNIENVEVTTNESTSEESSPVEKPVITSIRVDTFGSDYGLPETLEPFDYYSWLYEQYGVDLTQAQ